MCVCVYIHISYKNKILQFTFLIIRISYSISLVTHSDMKHLTHSTGECLVLFKIRIFLHVTIYRKVKILVYIKDIKDKDKQALLFATSGVVFAAHFSFAILI